MSSVKVNIPKIDSISDDKETLSFTVKNCNVSVINALRRTLLADIDMVVIDTNKEIQISENTSLLNNEILKQRLGCIPVHIKKTGATKKLFLNLKNVSLIIDVENTSDQIMYVTTNDFKIQENSSGKFINKEAMKKIFPVNSMTKDPIIFGRLKPKISSTIPGEKLKIKTGFNVSSAREDGRYNAVCTCAYGNLVDKEKQQAALNIFLESLKSNDPTISESTLKYEEDNWLLLKGKQHIINDAFRFKVESVGVHENRELVVLACDKLIENSKRILSLSNEHSIEILPNQIANNFSYDIILQNEDYTMGKLIEYVFYENYFEKNDIFSYVGFIKKHPHDDYSIIRIIFNDKEKANNDNIYKILSSSLEAIIQIYKDLRSNFTT